MIEQSDRRVCAVSHIGCGARRDRAQRRDVRQRTDYGRKSAQHRWPRHATAAISTPSQETDRIPAARARSCNPISAPQLIRFHFATPNVSRITMQATILPRIQRTRNTGIRRIVTMRSNPPRAGRRHARPKTRRDRSADEGTACTRTSSQGQTSSDRIKRVADRTTGATARGNRMFCTLHPAPCTRNRTGALHTSRLSGPPMAYARRPCRTGKFQDRIDSMRMLPLRGARDRGSSSCRAGNGSTCVTAALLPRR